MRYRSCITVIDQLTLVNIHYIDATCS